MRTSDPILEGKINFTPLLKMANVVFAKSKKQAKKSGKEKASDAPSWAKGQKPKLGEKADDFTKRVLNNKYGRGNYKTGPGSEYSEIKKWVQRSLGLK